MKRQTLITLISASLVSMTAFAADTSAESFIVNKSTATTKSAPVKGSAGLSSSESREGAAVISGELRNSDKQSRGFVQGNSTRQSSTVFTLGMDSNKSAEAAQSLNKSDAKKDRQKLNQQSRDKRTKAPAKSSRSHDFEIYDARTFLFEDIDGDGYYSEFQVEFDADTVYSWAEVYAKLYVSYEGGPWELYHVTDVFEINGADSTDDYRVTTILNYDFPTGDYDILIDLYEYGYEGIVATYSDYDDADLSYLPLEDRTFESSYGAGFWFYDVTTDLLDDEDNDGFYHRFAISFDVDTDYASSDVYAEVYFLNEYNEWELEYATEDFALEGDTTLDTVHLEFDWDSGYPTGYYDFKVVIRDAYSNERLVETQGEFGALNALPLESYDRDDSYNSGGGTGSGSVGSGGSTTSYESGGGSLPLTGVLSLMTLLLLRARRTHK